jgi:hypothetical protein
MNKIFSKKISIIVATLFIFFSGVFFVNNISAAPYDDNKQGAHYLDIIGEHGFETNTTGAPDTSLMDVIIIIINAVLSFLGLIFIALIIYGGYMWMFSGGNEQNIEKAKKILTNSSIGVAIVLASAAISQLVINTINQGDMDVEDWINNDRSIGDIIIAIINIALSIFGLLFTGMIIYSGYTWMFSGGNEEKVAKAKKMLISSVVGAVIIMMSFAITMLIKSIVG